MGKKKQDRLKKTTAVPTAQIQYLEQAAPLPPAHRLLLLLMFLLLGVLAIRQVGSMDAGFHLKAGDYILSGHGWPGTDPFTYTLNDHPYTDTTWGYQVMLTLAHKAADAPGMVVFHLLILMALFFILYRTARLAPVDPATLVILLGAGILACEMRYEVRPEMLSCLFLAALLYLLHRHAHGLKVPLWFLPLLLWLWANCHALFVLGWAALACVAVGLWLKDRKPDKPLLLWSGLAFLTPLVNPYGLKGVLFPFTLMTRFQKGNPFAQSIGEFVSPFSLNLSDAYPFYPHWPIWTFRILAVLILLSLLFLLKQRKYWAVLLCLAFFPLSAKMIRNIPLLVIVSLPVMAWALPLSGLWRLLGMRESGARRARLAVLGIAGALAILLGLRVLTNAYYVSTRRVDRFGWGWNRLALPLDAADYLKGAGIKGAMLNHLNFGGALMWAQPERVFIDGRLEVVGEDFYRSYLEMMSSTEALEAAVSRYGIGYVILPYAVAPRFAGQLSVDPRWRLSYVDPLAVVYVRQGPDAEKWVDRTSVDRQASAALGVDALPGLGGPERRSSAMRWFAGLYSRQTFPSESYNLGLFRYFRKEYPQAEAWFRSALASGGEAYYEIYLNLGSALYQQKKYDEAAACYEVVLREAPENKVARERLAALDRVRMQKR